MASMLAIHPGPHTSTFDVYRGLVPALQELGAELVFYPLDRALTLAREYCAVLEDKGYIGHHETMPAQMADWQYIASVFALDRALHYDVEWVLVFAGALFHPDTIVKLQRAGRKIAVLFTESPYESDRELTRARFVDVAFTNERSTAREWRAAGVNARYLPHAIDPTRHHPEPSDAEPAVHAHDVVFVGTAWPERVHFLEAINWDGIDFGLYGIGWDRFTAPDSPLRAHLTSGEVPNETTTALYRQARIGLNLHRYAAGAESLNPRARELAAAACFHLSDARAEGAELFGDLVPTFTTPAECEGQIRYYLWHPGERETLRRQLPRTVQAETFAARAGLVLGALAQASGVRDLVAA